MEATYLSRRSDPTVSLSMSGPRASFVHTLPPTVPDKSGAYDYNSNIKIGNAMLFFFVTQQHLHTQTILHHITRLVIY